jgi:hypothetical protein
MTVYALHRDYRIIRLMQAIDLYIKVEADLDNSEDPKRFAEELCRVLARVYGVRRAELSSLHDVGAE